MTDQTLDLELFETAVTDSPDDAPATAEEPPRRRRGRPRKNPQPPETGAASPDARSTGGTGRKPGRPAARIPASLAGKFEARVETIEGMLTGAFGFAGVGMVMAGMSCTGTTMTMRSQQGAQAVISAARVNPALMRILVRMTEANAWTPLVLFGVTIAVAASVDIRVMDIHGFIPARVIPEIVQMVDAAQAQPDNAVPFPQPTEVNGSVPVSPFQDASRHDAAGMTDA